VSVSALPIPFQGPYCLRHSYAVHLLRLGVSIKIIGDLLGHRITESTATYLRLSLKDLREVTLPLPQEVTHE
jgi:integrase/recombinase XerD